MCQWYLLQDVKFPLQLDVFDLCSPELQKKLVPMRDRFKEEDEKQIEKARVSFTA
jgi:ubiquitin carboxyl-terminal hydrolase 14